MLKSSVMVYVVVDEFKRKQRKFKLGKGIGIDFSGCITKPSDQCVQLTDALLVLTLQILI